MIAQGRARGQRLHTLQARVPGHLRGGNSSGWGKPGTWFQAHIWFGWALGRLDGVSGRMKSGARGPARLGREKRERGRRERGKGRRRGKEQRWWRAPPAAAARVVGRRATPIGRCTAHRTGRQVRSGLNKAHAGISYQQSMGVWRRRRTEMVSPSPGFGKRGLGEKEGKQDIDKRDDTRAQGPASSPRGAAGREGGPSRAGRQLGRCSWHNTHLCQRHLPSLPPCSAPEGCSPPAVVAVRSGHAAAGAAAGAAAVVLLHVVWE